MEPKDYGPNNFTKYYGYIIPPYLTTKETPFTMVYDADVMLPVKIDTPTCRCSQFNEKENKVGLRCNIILSDSNK